MKKHLLTKMLLVAAMLGLGTSAWAESTSLYERGTTNAWDAADLSDWAQSYCTATISGGLSVTTKNGGWTCTKSLSVTKNALVVLDATLKTGGAPGRSGSYDYISIGGVSVRFNEQDKVASVDIDGATTNLSLTYNRASAYVIQIVIDQAKGDVSYTVGSASGTGSSSTAITNVVFGHSKAGKENYDINPILQKIEIQEEEQDVTDVNYTVNYKLNEEIVKTVSSTSVVGATITADLAVDGEGTYEGNHYLITAAEAPSMTLVSNAASNVLNVPVRAPYAATLNVTYNIGGVAQTPIVTNLTETDDKVCSWTYAYPMYVQKDGVYYVADETSSFGESGTFTNEETINKTVDYTNPDYTVVYYDEPNEETGINTSYSNGNTGYITGGVVYSSDKVIRLGQLPAGSYRLITNVTEAANRNVVVGDYTAGTESFPEALITITSTGAKDEEFTVDGTQLICISGKDQGSGKFNQSATIDYILVKASTQVATIGTTGYTSFASSYPLNIRGMTASEGDVEAYYVEESGVKNSYISFTASPDNVAAGTGLILKGEAGATVTIPVATSGTDLSATNKLVGCPTATTITSGTANYENIYVLGASKAEFQNIKNWIDTNSSLEIPAGKAYLDATGVSTAPTLTFNFGGESTGISEMRNAQSTMFNEVYNLNGQRVAQPTKGLYITNGRKVVVK